MVIFRILHTPKHVKLSKTGNLKLAWIPKYPIPIVWWGTYKVYYTLNSTFNIIFSSDHIMCIMIYTKCICNFRYSSFLLRLVILLCYYNIKRIILDKQQQSSMLHINFIWLGIVYNHRNTLHLNSFECPCKKTINALHVTFIIIYAAAYIYNLYFKKEKKKALFMWFF